MTELNTEELIDKGKKTNIVLDASVLTTLMSCPCLADLRFNHNLESIKGKANSLECGSIVHKYMESYYGSIIKGINTKEAHGYGMTSAEMYIRGCSFCTEFTPTDELIKPSCGHRKNEYPGLQNTPAESETNKTGWKWVLETCEQYYEHYKFDSWVPLETEVVKSEVLYEDEDIRILWKAKLDLVSDTHQGILPIDHKTMKQNRQQLNLNNQFTGQCIIQKTRNMIINKIGFQKTLKADEKFKREVVGYTPQRLIEWQSEILPYYAKMLLMYHETGIWPRNYTHCEGKYGLCSFHGVCSANPDMREEELRINFKVGEPWNPTNEDE